MSSARNLFYPLYFPNPLPQAISCGASGDNHPVASRGRQVCRPVEASPWGALELTAANYGRDEWWLLLDPGAVRHALEIAVML